MSTVQNQIDPEQQQAIAEEMGVPLGLFRAKWSQAKLARYEPGWSQSVEVLASRFFESQLVLTSLEGSVDMSDVVDAMLAKQPAKGEDEELYRQAFLANMNAITEFAQYWGPKVGRRRAKEFGEDIGSLSAAIGQGLEKFASLSAPPPPRPDGNA